jgi:hypothetical protein
MAFNIYFQYWILMELSFECSQTEKCWAPFFVISKYKYFVEKLGICLHFVNGSYVNVTFENKHIQQISWIWWFAHITWKRNWIRINKGNHML